LDSFDRAEAGAQRPPRPGKEVMNARYRLVYRGIRGGMYYCVDKNTGKRTSLYTANEDAARQIVEAKNASVAPAHP
jgi:hypothetical protein